MADDAPWAKEREPSVDRVIAFSDGVVAIAITLLPRSRCAKCCRHWGARCRRSGLALLSRRRDLGAAPALSCSGHCRTTRSEDVKEAMRP